MADVGAGVTTYLFDEHGYYKPTGVIRVVDKIIKNEDVIDEMYRIFYF
jgi:hypothetical protein